MIPLPIRFCAGINNNDPPIDLKVSERGETQSLVNASTIYRGRLKLERPKVALNSIPELSSVHSVFRAGSLVLIGTGTSLKYKSGSSFVILTAMLSGDKLSMTQAGDWVFICNGTNKKAVYIPGPILTDWGQSPPSVAPTVADSGIAGNPTGTYSCYYRYKITLPDGSILRTDLSPVGTVVLGALTHKISWSNLAHSSFEGATTRAIELFRTKVGFSATYLVAEIAEGTTTYDDDIDDTPLQASTEFDEDGYYPPPSGAEIAFYHKGPNRVFCTVNEKGYWSEPALYHVFLYNETANEYSNVQSVFLGDEDIKAMIILDQQLYFGSQKSWERLRGYNPDYWTWESILSVKGPINWQSIVMTPWGVLYPGNDGYLWIFNGFDTKRFAGNFIFGTTPDSASHATFDGRFYRLFYNDATYPELIIDMDISQGLLPKVVQGTMDMECSYYHIDSNSLYLGDANGYLRSGDDVSQSVTLSFLTGEITPNQLVNLDDVASLLIEANTLGADLIITPYQDGKPQTSLTPVKTTSMERVPIPLPLNIYRALSLYVSIQTSNDIEIREPWMVDKEDNG